MLIFNCTQAACDFFSRVYKGKKLTEVQIPSFARIEEDAPAMLQEGLDPAEMEQWLVHATVVQDKHVLIAIHIETRYMMFFCDMRKADVLGFIQNFTERWMTGMIDNASHSELLEMVDYPSMTDSFLPFNSEYVLFKRGDRSAQRHINEALSQFKERVHYNGCLPPTDQHAANFDARMNETPRGIRAQKDMIFPDEEMLMHWLQRFCGVTDAGAKKAREWRSTLMRKRATEKWAMYQAQTQQ